MKIDLAQRDAFVARFGGIYEHSPWVAQRLCDRGEAASPQSPKDLAGPMAAVVEAADHNLQLQLLRAHPDLAGKLAKSGELTADSTEEQASAGLDQCTEAEFQEFTDLNATYRHKFGFPFILAVRGRSRVEILENFRARVGNETATEFRTALDQVHQIAKLRLEAMED